MTDDDPLTNADVRNAAASTGESGPSAAGTGTPTAAAVVRSSQTPETGLVYGSADEWLRKYWRYTYRRRVSGKGSGTGRWKAQWWNTDEAVQRLDALWRSWEASRHDPGLGMSTWWINHAEPHMNALLATDGPFAGSTDENLPGDPLPYQRPPAGTFPPDNEPPPPS